MGDGNVLRGPGTRPPWMDVSRERPAQTARDANGQRSGHETLLEVNLLLWPAEDDHRNAAPAEAERNETERNGTDRNGTKATPWF